MRVVFGADQDFPPFEFRTAAGGASGFQVELVRAIGRAMGFELEVVVGPWKEIRAGFLAGEIHVVGLFEMDERRQYADFCEPHSVGGSEIFRRLKTDEVSSLEDLAGKAVILQSGALAAEFFRSRGINAELIEVATEADAVRLLASGKHDYAVVTQYGGRSAMKRHGLTNLTTTGPLVLSSNYSLAVRKGNDDLRARLNQGLEIIKQNGEYNRLYDRWLDEYTHRDYGRRLLTRILVWVVIPLGLLAVGATLWSRLLQRQVRLRTEQLRQELDRRASTLSALEESERRFRTLTDQAPEAILLVDPDSGRNMEANENASWLFKLDRDAILQSDPLLVLGSAGENGAVLTAPTQDVIRRALLGESVLTRTVLRDGLGQLLPCELRAVRLAWRGRWLLRVSITDITDRVTAERREALMRSELDHRVRNAMATVVGLSQRLAADSNDLAEFREAFVPRVIALAQAHDALSASKWQGVALTRAIELIVKPMVVGTRQRLHFRGVDVTLPAAIAPPMCMVLHELASNASLHGALRHEDGQIVIEAHADSDDLVVINWSEESSVPAPAEINPGSGLSLVRGLIEYQARGTLEISTQDGVFRARMSFSVSPTFWQSGEPAHA